MALATQTGVHTSLSRADAERCGMGLAVTAREHPERLAVSSRHGDRSFDFLNARVNQLVRALRARGLRAGDGLAVLCSNRPEFAVAVYAALRGGWRLTPINWHFTASEIAYIVDDCDAGALLADARFRAPVEGAMRSLDELPVGLAIGGPIHGFEAYDDALEEQDPGDVRDPELGAPLLYTSGTTGRPKGVHRTAQAAALRPDAAAVLARIGYREGRDLHLVTGPLYHAAPLAFSLTMPLNAGCGVVMMDAWDAERALELIQNYRISHTHFVPIMFHRLLLLPEDVRDAYDVSSVRVILHGAAPCPVAVKREILDWFGPVVWEYYAATEGWGCLVGPEEWLERPGTVGRPAQGDIQIRDDEGKLQPPGTPGTVYLRSPDGPFEYYKDPDKTRQTFSGEYFTLGDVGYLDADGWLFLNDRSADVINSGGANVYPAEVDAVLLAHPAVQDAATVGAPDPDWGEMVVSLVELREGVAEEPELGEALIDHCQQSLAHFKCPRRVEFVYDLPRTDSGKLQRRLLRERIREEQRRRA